MNSESVAILGTGGPIVSSRILRYPFQNANYAGVSQSRSLLGRRVSVRSTRSLSHDTNAHVTSVNTSIEQRLLLGSFP